MAEIKLDNVTKTFGDIVAVDDVSLEVQDGELLVLVGPSGCGKTTTLRMISGLEFPTEGRVFIGNEDVTELAPRNRDIAMVFQDLGLFPHLNVRENMSFVLKMRGFEPGKIDERVREATEILQIPELIDRPIQELSGGQQQRVALGRAIVRDPQVFLMDEPLGALDAKLRQEMRAEILELHKTIEGTMIYVTHDQEIAMTLGDRIAVMHEGEIQQLDDPATVYQTPENLFVAQFIGSPDMNIFDATIVSEGSLVRIESDSFAIPLVDTDMDFTDLAGNEMKVGIRPQDIHHAEFATGDVADNPSISITAEIVEDMGSISDVHFTRDSTDFIARVSTSADVETGEKLDVLFDTRSILLFNPETGERIVPTAERPLEKA